MFALSFIYMTLRLHEGMRRECVLIPDVSVPSSDTMPGIQEVINNYLPPAKGMKVQLQLLLRFLNLLPAASSPSILLDS